MCFLEGNNIYLKYSQQLRLTKVKISVTLNFDSMKLGEGSGVGVRIVYCILLVEQQTSTQRYCNTDHEQTNT